jgi:endonuclease YncB( thermonuclease family)
LLLCSCLAPLQVASQTCPATVFDETTTVKSVHDGDTVRLMDGRKIRLIGINAPELARNKQPEQALATDSRDRLKQLLSQANNRVKLVYGKQRLDRYQRTLAHLFLPDGKNLQADLLQRGLATANTYPPNVAFTDCYVEVEQLARCQNAGIWSLNEYKILNSSQLSPEANGYHLLSGLVERVSESDKGFWIFLTDGIMLGVRKPDLKYFEIEQLRKLNQQKITVRGWLHPKKKITRGVKYYMRVRHPSAIGWPGSKIHSDYCSTG